MDLATNRAAYRLADQHDQEVLGYLSGYAQSTLHSLADTVNTTVNGTKAVSTAGSDELLSSMKLKKGDFGNITTHVWPVFLTNNKLTHKAAGWS
jgi:hypothetical protein